MGERVPPSKHAFIRMLIRMLIHTAVLIRNYIPYTIVLPRVANMVLQYCSRTLSDLVCHILASFISPGPNANASSPRLLTGSSAQLRVFPSPGATSTALTSL